MPAVIRPSDENTAARRRFFEAAFGDNPGYVCVALKTSSGAFRQAFFQNPSQRDDLLAWVDSNIEGRDLYFCPNLFKTPERIKANVSSTPTLWADLDEVDPDKIIPVPSVLLTTSPGRYQALWVVDPPPDPYSAEDASRRLAHGLKADLSGWDLTQLLRIPITYNLKPDYSEAIVRAQFSEKIYKLTDFDDFEEAPAYVAASKEFRPEQLNGLDAGEIMDRNRRKLVPHAWTLFNERPDDDWSKALFTLECYLLEAGCSPEETFVVAKAAKCNKYARDNRGDKDLWREVMKAKAGVDARNYEEAPALSYDPLLTTEEYEVLARLPDTFVERYTEWGKTRTDAAWQYHEAGALAILSTLLADRVKLETSFGTVMPNLWIMLLGSTTLSRKTTSQEMAMELLFTVDQDAVLATDGSIEGILTALGKRDSRSSMFWRDEFSGLLDSMQKRDYYTGMVEALTKLYDGKYLKRVLRSETIEVRNPVFIMFVGGVKSRILELLSPQYVLSGFVPRFIFFSPEEPTDFRPIGPPGPPSESAGILDEVGKIAYNYGGEQMMKIGNQMVKRRATYDATLTPDAWDRYNVLERNLVGAGAKSEMPDYYTPMMDRLSKSMLKTAMLIAASRQDPPVVVEIEDILRAIRMGERWVPTAIDIVQHSGKTISERTIERAYSLIKRGKDSRAGLMRAMHLDSREAERVLDTLEQRGMIHRSRDKKSEKLFPTTSQTP